MKIDSHQHFWTYHPDTHGWIDDSMQAIRQSFFPNNLEPLLKAASIDGCVAVQADQTETETQFLLQLAKENPFIKGVVGWVDLRSENIEEQLAALCSEQTLKGFRHILQGEAPEFMLQPAFLNGIAALATFEFTYDILIFPKHLAAATTLVKKFPNQPFVIDHLAKPYIKAGLIDEWKTAIREIAKFENVSCKISGMVTEADYQQWQPTDFKPYLDVAVEAFGTKRLMYGSDWPVCLVAADYNQQLDIVENYFAHFSQTEKEAIMGGNAKAFYNL